MLTAALTASLVFADPVNLNRRLTEIRDAAKRLEDSHRPLRRALVALEAKKAAFAADPAACAGCEAELTALVDALRAEMRVQTVWADDAMGHVERLVSRLKPPVAHGPAEEALLEQGHKAILAAYRIPPPAAVPMWRGAPHPLAKYSGYLPDRVEIAVDQLRDARIGPALGAPLAQAKELVRAYNGAMYGLDSAYHELEEALEGEGGGH